MASKEIVGVPVWVWCIFGIIALAGTATLVSQTFNHGRIVPLTEHERMFLEWADEYTAVPSSIEIVSVKPYLNTSWYKVTFREESPAGGTQITHRVFDFRDGEAWPR